MIENNDRCRILNQSCLVASIVYILFSFGIYSFESKLNDLINSFKEIMKLNPTISLTYIGIACLISGFCIIFSFVNTNSSDQINHKSFIEKYKFKSKGILKISSKEFNNHTVDLTQKEVSKLMASEQYSKWIKEKENYSQNNLMNLDNQSEINFLNEDS